jgi:rubrerythrin
MNSDEIDELFSVAIGREIEANEFYKAVAKRVRNPAVAEIFSDLAREEHGHMEVLEKYKHDPTLEMKIQAPVSDFKIAESMNLPRLSPDAKPADAIALAMKKEQQAVEFYRALALRSSDSALKQVLDNLANMELVHKHRLENAFVEIGYPEVF